jgi:citrate synthase
LSNRPPSQQLLKVLNAALILLADHELAVSTLAARIAASAWAGPYLVVQTGLGTLGGLLHGATGPKARAMMEQIGAGSAADQVLGRLLSDDGVVPGFGGEQRVSAVDPRLELLLPLVRELAPARRWAVVQEILDLASARLLPTPNVEFAVAALAYTTELVHGASEVIFAVARCAGWIAHSLEEYPHRSSFRIRALYTGPEPRGDYGLSPPGSPVERD